MIDVDVLFDMIEDMLMFFETPKKMETTTSTRRPILTIGKSVKITIVCGKKLTICEKFRGRVATWLTLPKKGNGWMCTMDEKEMVFIQAGGQK